MRGRFVVAAGALLALACARERPPKKTHLARIPTTAERIVIADDATQYAYVDQTDAGARIVHNGAVGALYRGCSAPKFAPRTRKLFYWAGDAALRGFLVADGNPIGGVSREGMLVFTADGQRWAVATGTPDRSLPVVVLADGRELGRFSDASVPAFSPDGKHLAYLADAEGGVRLIVDGEERAAYPTSSASCARRIVPRGSGPYVWPQFQVRYLSDGRLLVFTQDADGWGIYRDGTRVASYGASVGPRRPSVGEECQGVGWVDAASLATAKEAPVAAWWERLPGSEDRWRVVRDGTPVDEFTCAKFWEAQPPEFSPDGRRLAYACAVKEPEEGVFLVADGQRYGPYRDMWAYAWADDAAHIAYGASGQSAPGLWQYYVDGQPRTDTLSAVWRPRLEARTGRLAWEGELEPGAPAVLGLDRQRITSFDEILWGPTFLHRGSVTWVIRRGRRITRLDVPIR